MYQRRDIIILYRLQQYWSTAIISWSYTRSITRKSLPIRVNMYLEPRVNQNPRQITTYCRNAFFVIVIVMYSPPFLAVPTHLSHVTNIFMPSKREYKIDAVNVGREIHRRAEPPRSPASIQFLFFFFSSFLPLLTHAVSLFGVVVSCHMMFKRWCLMASTRISVGTFTGTNAHFLRGGEYQGKKLTKNFGAR